ncbi:MAG TPA: ankyrin repeat domain-containing protein [Bryobacteraceae bacterium]|nr:ankyrin repeat domain-containing protein [Bryobacteraceae bacterium]
MRRVIVLAVLARALAAQTTPEIRKAVERALPVLEKSATTFVNKRACISCHHNILPILVLNLARERGVAIDSAALAAVEDKTFRVLTGPPALDDAIQATTLNDPTPNDSFLLMAAHAGGLAPDLTTAIYARRLANWQRDSHWITSDFRPPHSSSMFTATASAVRAISLYMPAELRKEMDSRIEAARRWLVATRPASTEDASFRLMGLVWAQATAEDLAAARRDLLALRIPAGSWPELPGYPADAYSTGEALYALRESGMAVSDRAWATGVRFLLSSQAADGTWRVHTRMVSPADVSPAYFPSGFPYEKDEYLSYAGSSWAVMAMLSALPAVQRQPEPRQIERNDPPWIRTALFGSMQQLTEALNQGLSPNARTEKGTSLLMMAAPDADKVRLLLNRGAEMAPKALAIATAYRGTAESVKALLDAGADAKTRKALEYAAMAGDPENVKLLVAHGADPAPGLYQAVTFGYPDLVRYLISAGASVKVTESSGINLLHWAAIANRPEVIPILASAGASINSTDDFLYTPLMYAATIDFGDTQVLKALLKAGADPKIRNDEGRTAIEQARYYHHSQLEAGLR